MKRSVRVQDVIRAMDTIAPPHLALPKDKIGLQVGQTDKAVSRVWVALEATPETVEAAVAGGIDMIVTHHSLLFHPITKLETSQPRHRAISRLLSAGIVVYSAHTNLDVAAGGVNDVIARRLGLEDVEILDVTYREPLYKLVVYVPRTHLDVVRSALGHAGAGAIGRYTHCTFTVEGTGTFRPCEGTVPYLGEIGQIELVPEARIETVVPESLLQMVIKQMQAVHPYEEVAYDLLPMHQTGQEYGIGRIGNLGAPMTLASFADHARRAFCMPHIRYVGDRDLAVTRVAVLGGSGSRWVNASLAKGAQVLLTADVGHHEASDSWQDGMAIVDATHAALEQPVCEIVAERLTQLLGNDADVHITAAPVDVDPFQWI